MAQPRSLAEPSSSCPAERERPPAAPAPFQSFRATSALPRRRLEIILLPRLTIPSVQSHEFSADACLAAAPRTKPQGLHPCFASTTRRVTFLFSSPAALIHCRCLAAATIHPSHHRLCPARLTETVNISSTQEMYGTRTGCTCSVHRHCLPGLGLSFLLV